MYIATPVELYKQQNCLRRTLHVHLSNLCEGIDIIKMLLWPKGYPMHFYDPLMLKYEEKILKEHYIYFEFLHAKLFSNLFIAVT